MELTTLNQRLVTKKNGKVRRMAELYPDVRVTLLYQRDTLALLAKYGLAGDGRGTRAVARSPDRPRRYPFDVGDTSQATDGARHGRIRASRSATPH